MNWTNTIKLVFCKALPQKGFHKNLKYISKHFSSGWNLLVPNLSLLKYFDMTLARYKSSKIEGSGQPFPTGLSRYCFIDPRVFGKTGARQAEGLLPGSRRAPLEFEQSSTDFVLFLGFCPFPDGGIWAGLFPPFFSPVFEIKHLVVLKSDFCINNSNDRLRTRVLFVGNQPSARSCPPVVWGGTTAYLALPSLLLLLRLRRVLCSCSPAPWKSSVEVDQLAPWRAKTGLVVLPLPWHAHPRRTRAETGFWKTAGGFLSALLLLQTNTMKTL